MEGGCARGWGHVVALPLVTGRWLLQLFPKRQRSFPESENKVTSGEETMCCSPIYFLSDISTMAFI